MWSGILRCSTAEQRRENGHNVTAPNCFCEGSGADREVFPASELHVPADAAGACQADSYAPPEGRGLTPVCSGACAGARGRCLTPSPPGAPAASPWLPPLLSSLSAHERLLVSLRRITTESLLSLHFLPLRFSQRTCKGDASAYATFMTCISCHKYKSGGILR